MTIYHYLLKGDRVIFAESPSAPGIPVVYRTPEERSSNPDRLNLDRYSMLVYDFSSPGV
jgi:leucine-rich repeat-containing protein 49